LVLRQREQQEKAARLQKEVLAAKEQLQKEMEKKDVSRCDYDFSSHLMFGAVGL